MILFALAAAACSATPVATTTTAAATTTTATTLAPADDVIDLGAREPLGLAIAGEAVWAITFENGALSRIDPVSGEITSSETLGPQAASLLSVGDDLWAAAYGKSPTGAIYRIDPTSGETEATIRLEEVCCDLTAGDGAVFAVDPGGRVLQIDAETPAIEAEFDVMFDRNAHTNVVYGGGFLWASSDTTPLYRIDPVTGAMEEFDVGGGVPFFELEGQVWGAAPESVWAVDAVSGEEVERIDLEDSIEVISLAIEGDQVWAGIRHPGHVGAVLTIDRSTGQVLNEIDDIEIPARIVIGFGSVWITDSGSSSLFRIALP